MKIRLPAWAKGKSVILDMATTDIKLALKEEEDKPILEVTLYCFLFKSLLIICQM